MHRTRKSIAVVHPLLKHLGATDAAFKIDGNKLWLTKKGSPAAEVDVKSIGSPSTLKTGVLFSKIVLQTDRGKLSLKWLSKKQANEAHKWLRAYFYRSITPSVSDSAKQVLSILRRGYLRSSRLAEIRKIAEEYTSLSPTLPSPGLIEPENLEYFDLLNKVSGWGKNDIEQQRLRYVAKQSKQFADYFDNVESNPLTKSQREACIVDEDSNLVLAGAGTGKTSTMIGRAGYLLESGQAEPHQILMLAFGNKAAREMQERLNQRLGNDAIVASTFHKLGKEIIAQVEGAQPSVSPLAEDDKLLEKHVDEWFNKHMEIRHYSEKVLAYFSYYLYPEKNPFDFETEGEYFDYMLANEIRTLKGEMVKSLGECLLANHLLKLGIDYQYEAAYEHSTRDVYFRQYQPDFYLPEYGIYIEHIGIDRDGNTAPYVDREKYHRGNEWKRQLHVKHETCLIETYYYEQKEGCLLSELERKLEKNNVQFNPLPPGVVLESLKEFGAIGAFSSLLAKLLRLYKANHFDKKRLEEVIRHSASPGQVREALSLLQPIYEDYESLLARHKQIDFDDMIGKAIEHVSSGRFLSKWMHILVDEFQDISDPRARLVIALRDSVADSSLFCVGDDWQAIYRFTGSDLNFTTSFSEVFGATHVSALDKTFRFNNSICDVSSRFIQENPAQCRKDISTLIKVQRPAISLLRESKNTRRDQQPDQRLRKVLGRISEIAEVGVSVFLLGRFGFSLPNARQLQMLRENFPRLDISSHTMHASKGKEADFVVLLGLEKGKHGFPSQKVTDPLLEALLPGLEDFPYAEERRLFYVALTRARSRAYLIGDMTIASEFIVELLKENYPIDLEEFETSFTQKLFQLLSCTRCTTGTMVPRVGQYGRFFGCSHYPLCDNKENGCKSCGNPMQLEGRFKSCVNPDCDSWVPVCPDCGAEMAKRTGQYGSFWGCRNYRGNEDNSCSYTESNIVYPSVPVSIQ